MPLRPSRCHRRHLQAFLGFGALAALFYLPQLLGLRTFPEGDFNQHFLPFSLFQQSELLAGRLALWNPYTYAGHPFLADVQAAVFYPLGNLVLWLTLPLRSPAARLYFLEVEAALHLALAGGFTYLLVYDLTGRRPAAFLAGCAFAFSGYLTGYPPLQLAVLRTAIWLPLVFWLLLRAFAPLADRRGPSPWRWTVYAALAYATAFLAGHPQTFLFLSYATAAWVLLLAARSILAGRSAGARPGLPARRRWLPVGQALLFYLIFLGVAAAQLLPSVEFTNLSVRANVDYAFVSGGFPLDDTWQMILPGLQTVYAPLYAGVLVLGLALLAVIAPSVVGRGRGFVAFFALLGLAALLVSYGDQAFLYPIFHRWLPGWNLFRGQERAAYLVAFALSVLAGYGAAALEAGVPRRRLYAWAAGYGALLLGGTLLFARFWVAAGRTDPSLGDFRLTAARTLLVGAAGILLCLRQPLARSGSLALIALVVADLFLANLPTNLGPATPAQATAIRPEMAAVQAALSAQPVQDSGLPGRVHNEYRVFDDYGMMVGAEDVGGSSPLKLARYAALFQDFPLDRMWRLLGVGTVLTWQKTLPQPSETLAEFPQASDTTYLHRLVVANPRAWIVHETQRIGDEAALRLLADHQFNLDGAALLASDGPAAGPKWAALDEARGTSGAPGADHVWLGRTRPGELTAEVQSEHGGLLVISENWLPRWQARRRDPGGSGTETLPVLRADLTLLAVPVPAGASAVELAYRPASSSLGLAISLVTLVLLIGWGWARHLTRPARRAIIHPNI